MNEDSYPLSGKGSFYSLFFLTRVGINLSLDGCGLRGNILMINATEVPMLDHVDMGLYKIVNAEQDGREVDLTLLNPLRMNRYTQVHVPLPGDDWTSSRVLSSAAYGGGTPEATLTGQPIIVHRNDDGTPESISSVIMPGLRTRVLERTNDSVDDDHPETGDDTVDGTIVRPSSVRIVIDDKGQSFISMVFVDSGGVETGCHVPVDGCGPVVTGLVDAASTIMLRLSGMVMATPKALPVSSLVIGRPLRLDVDGHGRIVAFRSIYNGESFPVEQNDTMKDDYRHHVVGHDWEVEDHDDEDAVLGKERPVNGADIGLCRFTGRPALRVRFSDYEPGRRSSAWLPLDEDTIGRLVGVGNHDGTGMRYLSDIISGIRVGVVPSAVVGMSSIGSISS